MAQAQTPHAPQHCARASGAEAARGILITRPEPGASETAYRIAALGLVPILAPMLMVTSRRFGPVASPQAVLITSANAVAALDGLDLATPVYTVGDATAERAEQAGFSRVTSAKRDAQALAALVMQRQSPQAGPLLLASGARQGLSLAKELRQAGFRVIRRVAYRSRPIRRLPAEAALALAAGRVRAALFFSAETARAFASALPFEPALLSSVDALAISHPTAQAVCHLPWRTLRVAYHPNQEELVALLP
jgi:uroporphyrinogen-III synthase